MKFFRHLLAVASHLPSVFRCCSYTCLSMVYVRGKYCSKKIGGFHCGLHKPRINNTFNCDYLRATWACAWACAWACNWASAMTWACSRWALSFARYIICGKKNNTPKFIGKCGATHVSRATIFLPKRIKTGIQPVPAIWGHRTPRTHLHAPLHGLLPARRPYLFHSH